MTRLVWAVILGIVPLLTGCASRPLVVEPIAEVMAPSLPKDCPLHVLTAYDQARKLIDIDRFPWWGPWFPCEFPLWWQRITDVPVPTRPRPEFPPEPGWGVLSVPPRSLWELFGPPPDAPRP